MTSHMTDPAPTQAKSMYLWLKSSAKMSTHLTTLTWTKKPSPAITIQQSQMPPQHTPGKEWNKSGNIHAKPRPSEKDSSVVFQPICAMPWTKTSTLS
jgi:hypothetical protein